MRYSKAILKGMERFPRQSVGLYYREDKDSACVWGCINYALRGDPEKALWGPEFLRGRVARKFFDEYGARMDEVNDAGVPRDVIAGMLAAIGE